MDHQSKLETCKYIQANITKLCQNEIDQIFKILHQNGGNYSHNNNGVFVNLNWLDEDILNQIQTYINFCLTSQSEIQRYEHIKNIITDSLSTKEKVVDQTEQAASTSNIISTNISKQSKISSSMKFYLLKKRFLKKSTPTTNINNTLTHEEYVC